MNGMITRVMVDLVQGSGAKNLCIGYPWNNGISLTLMIKLMLFLLIRLSRPRHPVIGKNVLSISIIFGCNVPYEKEDSLKYLKPIAGVLTIFIKRSAFY